VNSKQNIDVLIVGAGAAGLAAWRRLHSAGLEVTVVEARERIGGRILTDHSTPTPVELGAEFVHGKSKALWPLLEKAGLRVIEGSDRHLISDKDSLHPNADFWAIIEKVNGQIEPGRELPYAQFLTAAKASALEKRIANSYVEGFNAARSELISTTAVTLGDRAAATIEGQRQFRVKLGYDSVIEWFATGLPRETLHLRTVVRQIRWRKQRVEVRAETPSGEVVFSAARLIVTVPLGVLKAPSGTPGTIQFIPSIPQKEAALESLEMGHVAKIMVCFKQRFWETNGPFGFASSFDEEVPTWWTQEPTTSNVLTGWAGGPPGEKLVLLSNQELLSRAFGSLSRIFAKPKSWLQECADKIFYHNWSDDPFSRGAYSYPKLGGLKAARFLAQPTNGTIFFAGEATDARGASGTVHAAIRSGTLAAGKILAAN
jgi:monoamine oxidase